VERTGAEVEGDELKLEAAGAAGYVVAGWAGAGAGYSFCLLLFHMVPPKWLPEICVTGPPTGQSILKICAGNLISAAEPM
jgi:hypothetical protein